MNIEDVKKVIICTIEYIMTPTEENDAIIHDKLKQIDSNNATELYITICETYRKCKYENTSAKK